MKYTEMKAKVYAYATRPNGYNGDTVRVGLARHEGVDYEVADCGYYHAPTEPTNTKFYTDITAV